MGEGRPAGPRGSSPRSGLLPPDAAPAPADVWTGPVAGVHVAATCYPPTRAHLARDFSSRTFPCLSWSPEPTEKYGQFISWVFLGTMGVFWLLPHPAGRRSATFLPSFCFASKVLRLRRETNSRTRQSFPAGGADAAGSASGAVSRQRGCPPGWLFSTSPSVVVSRGSQQPAEPPGPLCGAGRALDLGEVGRLGGTPATGRRSNGDAANRLV